MTGVLIRKESSGDTQILKEEGHVKMEAEVGVITKQHQGWLATVRS